MFPTLWVLFGLGKNANLSNNNFKCLVIQGVYLPNTNIKGCTQLRHTGFTNLPFSLQKGQVSNPWMTININICVHALFSMFQANLPSTAFNALIEVMCIFFMEERNDKLCFVVHQHVTQSWLSHSTFHGGRQGGFGRPACGVLSP